MKTTEELRARFSNEYGIGWENDEGEPDIDYVHFLEELLLSQFTESAGVGEQLESEGECSHCDGTGYMAENLDKSELIKCEYCSPQQPSEGEIKVKVGSKWDYDRSLDHSSQTIGLTVESVDYQKRLVSFKELMPYTAYSLSYFDGTTFKPHKPLRNY